MAELLTHTSHSRDSYDYLSERLMGTVWQKQRHVGFIISCGPSSFSQSMKVFTYASYPVLVYCRF